MKFRLLVRLVRDFGDNGIIEEGAHDPPELRPFVRSLVRNAVIDHASVKVHLVYPYLIRPQVQDIPAPELVFYSDLLFRFRFLAFELHGLV